MFSFFQVEKKKIEKLFNENELFVLKRDHFAEGLRLQNIESTRLRFNIFIIIFHINKKEC